jgi:transcriptional regulator with XRE-family HTH domain
MTKENRTLAVSQHAAAIQRAFPSYTVAVSVRQGGRPRFEVVTRNDDNPWCLISPRAEEIWQELEGISMPDLSMLASEELDGTVVRRRLIGSALRRHRERMGYRLEDAASVLECDRSKVSRIETGQRGIRPKELRELLTEYGVGEDEQRILSAIADQRIARRGWWQDYADIIPAAHLGLMTMEALAGEIMVYDTLQIPDLLQTPAYARAAAESDPGMPDPGTLDRLAEMSIARQQAIIHEQCTAITAVIGEGALRQRVGDAGVMRDQARWLAEISSTCPWLTLRVLPFGATVDPNRSGHMAILRYSEAPSLGVVHLRGLNGGVCLIGQAAIAGHLRVFTQLQHSALPPHQSAQLISEMAR